MHFSVRPKNFGKCFGYTLRCSSIIFCHILNSKCFNLDLVMCFRCLSFCSIVAFGDLLVAWIVGEVFRCDLCDDVFMCIHTCKKKILA